MTRWIFPEDRGVYLYTGPLQPILEPGRLAVEIYTEPECDVLADIAGLDRSVIPASTLYTGHDGLLPEFYGPDGVTRLYARALGRSDVYALHAIDSARVTDLDLHSIWEGAGLPQDGERVPPFIWLDLDGNVSMVTDGAMNGDGGPFGAVQQVEDVVTSLLAYVGYAPPGAARAQAAWWIVRVQDTVDGKVEAWAVEDGRTDGKIWDHRLAYTYG